MTNVFKTMYESQALGDCFPTANRLAIAHREYDVVHAFVWGTGAVEGRRFAHAWCEHNGRVIDKSNGNDVNLPVSTYYRIGGVNPNERGAYVRYTSDEALANMLRHQHHGPWDLDESLEEDFEAAGTKRLRLSPSELRALRRLT